MELKTRFSAGRKLLFITSEDVIDEEVTIYDPNIDNMIYNLLEVAIDLAFMANRPIQDYLNDLL
jgi:hypothetical protein